MNDTRHALAVVLLTTCRLSLARALRSVFRQRLAAGVRIQVLLGVDGDPHGRLQALLAALLPECPAHVTLTLINPGYSTSRRHGGPHASFYGGALRSALTLLADSRVVVYLDDDDWLKEDHCAAILHAIDGKAWAFSYSIYADGNTGQELCVDGLESVGVGRGIYAERFGGFVRPSGLAIDKLRLLHLVHLWSCAAFPTGDGEDRLVFEQLRHEPHGCTGVATVCCALDPNDALHARRVEFMRSQGVDYAGAAKIESSR
ncbi:hypothetical protein [Massilia sp. Root335]|uniref:hypothetical protein n=1 Tax=Massilia sp. Root335 TaxID=1736517 RepID=UPI0006F4CC71|nr:hypothetical protein [Massilia sp. Root335]KQV36730.1 hypothetical protein ASC93_21015 [Massilia sp. Root335]